MTTPTPNEAYALRTAADRAVNDVRKVLSPLLAEIVAAEIRWLGASTWAANRERLRLVIAEVNALGEGRAAA